MFNIKTRSINSVTNYKCKTFHTIFQHFLTSFFKFSFRHEIEKVGNTFKKMTFRKNDTLPQDGVAMLSPFWQGHLWWQSIPCKINKIIWKKGKLGCCYFSWRLFVLKDKFQIKIAKIMTYDFVAFGHAFVVVSLTIYPTNRIKFLQPTTLTIIYCPMTRALLITFYALQMI